MVVNLTEIDLTGLMNNPSYDNLLCQYNLFFDSLAIFIFLICIMIVLAVGLKIKFENSTSLCIFISSGLVTLVSLLLYFVNVEGCGRLLNFNQFSVFAVIFLASGLLLWFDKDNQD